MSEAIQEQPSLLRRFYAGFRRFGLKIAQVQNTILLAIVYVIIIVPIGAVLRLVGKSPLIQPRESPDSFWTMREQQPYTVERFKRMF